MLPIVSRLATIYRDKATRRYGLSAVSQLQHALQAATLAQRNGEDAEFVVAALLHDLGHMIHRLGEEAARDGIDDRHENRAAVWLSSHFGPAVTEPIRLHVLAKRYLCAVDPAYQARLASDSVRSLALQGGPLTAEGVAGFEARPYWREAVRLRLLDDAAKEPAAQTPPFEHFVPDLEQAARSRVPG